MNENKLNFNILFLVILVFFGLFQIVFSLNKENYNDSSILKNMNEKNQDKIFNSEYRNFLNFLKENYIININGIRNDSSIQYLSFNLKTGKIYDEENSDAYLEFDINQGIMDKIFSNGDIGKNFFKLIITGDIKMTRLDNRGVIEKVGSWFSSFFGSNENGDDINLSISCPRIISQVCGEDGITYDNGCFANKVNVKILHRGSC